jgi:hypothetical protein
LVQKSKIHLMQQKLSVRLQILIKKKIITFYIIKRKFIILLINFQIFQMNFLSMFGFGSTEKKKKGKRKNDNKNL